MRIIILYDLKGKAMELRNCEHLRELSDSDMSGTLQKILVLSLFGKAGNSTVSLSLYCRTE